MGRCDPLDKRLPYIAGMLTRRNWVDTLLFSYSFFYVLLCNFFFFFKRIHFTFFLALNPNQIITYSCEDSSSFFSFWLLIHANSLFSLFSSSPDVVSYFFLRWTQWQINYNSIKGNNNNNKQNASVAAPICASIRARIEKLYKEKVSREYLQKWYLTMT